MKVKFYITASGRSPVAEFIKELSSDTQLELVDIIAQLEAGKTLSMPLCRNLSSICRGLYELRLQDKGVQIRIIYYLKKLNAIYFIHGFRKKTQAIARKEVYMILKRIQEI
jgi:phage-related protein